MEIDLHYKVLTILCILSPFWGHGRHKFMLPCLYLCPDHRGPGRRLWRRPSRRWSRLRCGTRSGGFSHCHKWHFCCRQGCQIAKFNPFLSLDCARVEGVGAQSKEEIKFCHLASLEVMVVRTRYDQSRTEIECGVVEVEEDTSCSCDCPVQASDCSPNHYYDSSSCRCLCNDQSGRNRCISRGMQWDPQRCMCTCPTSSWRVCSSGYVYDFTDTCQCVPVVATSNAQGLAMFAALIVGGVLSIFSLVVYYRRQIRYYQRQMLKYESECQSIASSEDDLTCSLTLEKEKL